MWAGRFVAFALPARTTFIALVAASSFAAASVAPTLSQAATNQGGQKAHEAYCEALGGYFEDDVNRAGQLCGKQGNSREFKAAMAEAASALSSAQAAGCDWATRVTLPQRPIVAPVATGRLSALQ